MYRVSINNNIAKHPAYCRPNIILISKKLHQIFVVYRFPLMKHSEYYSTFEISTRPEDSSVCVFVSKKLC